MLKSLEIQNFTCFPEAKLEFSPGLNVIVGENGTGKTHLLKLGYAFRKAFSLTEDEKKDAIRHGFANFYSNMEDIFKSTVNLILFGGSESKLACSFDGSTDFIFTISKIEGSTGTFPQELAFPSPITPIFIPAKEILSIFKGFGPSMRKRELQFDKTYLDLTDALDLTKLIGEEHAKIEQYYKPIENILGRSIALDDEGDFSFALPLDKAEKAHIVKAQMSAEGHNKLGMLAWLVKNGSLGKGSSLFWDEPEANLNPKLLKALASILVELSSIMQITIATHSLFLLRELEILQEQKKITKAAKYFGLHFNEDGIGVTVTQGDTISDIGDIAALDESLAQSQRYRETQYGA